MSGGQALPADAAPAGPRGDRSGPAWGRLGGSSGGLARLALARGEVDRAAHRRSDAQWLAAAWANPGTRVLVIQDGKVLVRSTERGAGLVFLPSAQAPNGQRMLLGVAPGGVVYFGVLGPLADAGTDPQIRPASLREAGPLLSDRDAGLMTHAVALANWHAVFVHCPRCGTVTESVAAGHSRRCPNDGSEHFPKVDPAMIVLVTDPGDRCLLARNSQWPKRRVSILAGFVEAGESAEQAVTREVQEETGLLVSDIWYLGSQPWPMPQSLMLGFRALAGGDQQITVDSDEIAEANWFSRDELRAAVASGAVRLPPPVSIAHRIIESWYGAELPGTW